MSDLPSTIAISPINSAELTVDAQNALQVAQTFVIDSPAMYSLAGEELIAAKVAIKQLTERREDITKPLTAAHKSVMALFKPPLDFWESTKNAYSQRMIVYQTEQDRIRRLEQDRLEALARAERERLEAEAKKAMQQAAEKQDAAAILEAQAKLDIAASVVAPVAVTPAISSFGNSVRETWKAKVVNKAELVQWIASTCAIHPEVLDYLTVDAAALNAAARLSKKNLKIGGVESYLDKGITSRTPG